MLRGAKFFALVLAVVALFGFARSDLQHIREVANSANFIVTQMAEVTRLEKEMLQFRVNAAAIVNGNSSISRDDYLLSFDVLWSRVNTDRRLFVHTPVQSLLSFSKDIAGLAAAMKDIDPLVQSLQAGGHESLARIEKVMSEFAPAMAELNNEAYRELYDSSIGAALAQRAVVRGLDHVQWIFLMSGFSVLVILLAQLRRGERLYRELSKRETEIRAIAAIDPLTGLNNRRHFDERMTAIDQGTWTADLHMLLVDLDGFKQVNDQWGHEAGDHLLRAVARRLPAAAGHDALIARLGGDEFALIVKGSGSEARRMALAVIREISAPVVHDGTSLRVGASIGISSLRSVAMASSVMLREADAALYQAKAQGKGKALHFEDAELQAQSAA